MPTLQRMGLPARDLAFFCSTGLAPDLRRSCEEAVQGAYHQALVGYSVENYGIEDCADDYAYSMLQGVLIIVLGWAVAEKTERGDAMFATMTDRVCRDRRPRPLRPPLTCRRSAVAPDPARRLEDSPVCDST